MPNIVLLKGAPLRDEGVAAEAITPGALVERTSTGTVQNHSTAGASAAPVFAKERALAGDGLADAYASGDTVLLLTCRQGDEIYAFVAAAATAITAGDFLESDGAGGLQVIAVDAATDNTERESVVAQAMESVDNSGGGSIARIKVRVV